MKAEAELPALPEARLEHLLPPIDWMPAAKALDEALQDWLDNELPSVPVGFLVGQPYCGHTSILETWASLQDAAVIVPPDHEQILGGDLEWLDRRFVRNHLWVLPRLEHCYLRHANGLELIRQLFEKAESGALGRGLIGCDSWAWAYLQRIRPTLQSSAKTFQAFDGDRLTRFFARLGSRTQRLRFCNARTGEDVLPDLDALKNDDFEVSAELKELAAHCRGNVGIAWRSWRARLRSEPEDDDTRPVEDASSAETDGSKEAIVWVAAPPADPAMPGESDEDVALLLHALLIHNGLPGSILPELLPLPSSRIAAILVRLRALELLELQKGEWRVAARGYAVTREYLHKLGFLTDSF